jgi:coenzyme F420-0:L-glutamate ligase / coenzyme F420-1:gamma-L-glutamate ligase
VLSLIPIHNLPFIQSGDDIAQHISSSLEAAGESLAFHDVLVVAQKIVSKAEGRIVGLEQVVPSEAARQLAEQAQKDPRLVELILSESRDIIRVRPGLIVVEDVRGFICANAGIDRSNVPQEGQGEEVALLPLDPDASALAIRQRLLELRGVSVAVIINDSHGRAFREGTVGVAVGVSGLSALSDRRGDRDLTGYTLQHTVIGIADEIASAASLLMGPADEGVPAVLARGLHLPEVAGTARDLQRPRELDLFR